MSGVHAVCRIQLFLAQSLEFKIRNIQILPVVLVDLSPLNEKE